MKDLLERFYQDEHTRKALKAFQVALLEEMAIKDVFEKGGSNGEAIKEAKTLIDKSYQRLGAIYGSKEESNKQTSR